MSAARISPAASLLRNSKLFALPPAIALPTPEPSSEPVPRSDSATSIYPTRAAIETAGISLFKGDWGLKRPLPLKSTVKSRAIRLNKGIDTREHIADFDSATDHVMTLKKFQHLHVALEHPNGGAPEYTAVKGVFTANRDNTTNTSSTAPGNTTYTGVWPNVAPSTLPAQLPKPIRRKQEEVEAAQQQDPFQRGKFNAATSQANTTREQLRRWRFDGPSLVQMSGLEFDQFLNSLDADKRSAFRTMVKQALKQDIMESAAAKARDDGTVGDESSSITENITDEQVTDHIRKLRQQPSRFGPLIAEFLDLPDGPVDKGLGAWRYRSKMLSANYYEDAGPPRTHPSAGISYIQNNKYARNNSLFGPRHESEPVVSRLVKIKTKGLRNNGSHGIAGFIVKEPWSAQRGVAHDIVPAFAPSSGGLKIPVAIKDVGISEKGAVQMSTKPVTDYVVEDDKVLHHSMAKNATTQRPTRRPAGRIMQSLTPGGTNYRRREPLKQDEDVSDILAQFAKDQNASS